MTPELKNFLVVKDRNNEYNIWTRPEYEAYIRQCGEAGAGSAFKLVIDFKGDEDLLKDEKRIGPVWVNAGFKFPEDWEVKHLRYVADHYPVENSLFEHIRNGLCKIDGTGRLEYHEFEWLDESGSTPSQDDKSI